MKIKRLCQLVKNLVGEQYPVLASHKKIQYIQKLTTKTVIISVTVRSARELAILALKDVQLKVFFENIKITRF